MFPVSGQGGWFPVGSCLLLPWKATKCSEVINEQLLELLQRTLSRRVSNSFHSFVGLLELVWHIEYACLRPNILHRGVVSQKALGCYTQLLLICSHLSQLPACQQRFPTVTCTNSNPCSLVPIIVPRILPVREPRERLLLWGLSRRCCALPVQV